MSSTQFIDNHPSLNLDPEKEQSQSQTKDSDPDPDPDQSTTTAPEQDQDKDKTPKITEDSLPTTKEGPNHVDTPEIKIPLDINDITGLQTYLELPSSFTWEVARTPIHWLTIELKRRAKTTKNLLLPFRSPQDNTNLVYLLTILFPNESIPDSQLTEKEIIGHINKNNVWTLIQCLKYIWCRLPNGGILHYKQYLKFKKDELSNELPNDSFFNILPKYLDGKDQASIVYDFFDLIKIITSNGFITNINSIDTCKIYGIWCFGGLNDCIFYSGEDTAEHTSKSVNSSNSPLEIGIEGYFKIANALFHLYLSFLRHFTKNGIKKTSSINNELKKLLIDYDYPPIDFKINSNLITIPLVQLHTPVPSDDLWQLLNRCKMNLNLNFDNPDLFKSRENFALLKILFKNLKDIKDLNNSFTEDTENNVKSLTTRHSTLNTNWPHSKYVSEKNTIQFDDYLQIKNVEIDKTFYWSWLSTLSNEQSNKKKSLFGRCVLLEFNISNNLNKFIFFEDTQINNKEEPEIKPLKVKKEYTKHSSLISPSNIASSNLDPKPISSKRHSSTSTKSTPTPITSNSKSNTSNDTSTPSVRSHRRKNSRRHHSHITPKTSNSSTHTADSLSNGLTNKNSSNDTESSNESNAVTPPAMTPQNTGSAFFVSQTLDKPFGSSNSTTPFQGFKKLDAKYDKWKNFTNNFKAKKNSNFSNLLSNNNSIHTVSDFNFSILKNKNPTSTNTSASTSTSTNNNDNKSTPFFYSFKSDPNTSRASFLIKDTNLMKKSISLKSLNKQELKAKLHPVDPALKTSSISTKPTLPITIIQLNGDINNTKLPNGAKLTSSTKFTNSTKISSNTKVTGSIQDTSTKSEETTNKSTRKSSRIHTQSGTADVNSTISETNSSHKHRHHRHSHKSDPSSKARSHRHHSHSNSNHHSKSRSNTQFNNVPKSTVIEELELKELDDKIFSTLNNEEDDQDVRDLRSDNSSIYTINNEENTSLRKVSTSQSSKTKHSKDSSKNTTVENDVNSDSLSVSIQTITVNKSILHPLSNNIIQSSEVPLTPPPIPKKIPLNNSSPSLSTPFSTQSLLDNIKVQQQQQFSDTTTQFSDTTTQFPIPELSQNTNVQTQLTLANFQDSAPAVLLDNNNINHTPILYSKKENILIARGTIPETNENIPQNNFNPQTIIVNSNGPKTMGNSSNFITDNTASQHNVQGSSEDNISSPTSSVSTSSFVSTSITPVTHTDNYNTPITPFSNVFSDNQGETFNNIDVKFSKTIASSIPETNTSPTREYQYQGTRNGRNDIFESIITQIGSNNTDNKIQSNTTLDTPILNSKSSLSPPPQLPLSPSTLSNNGTMNSNSPRQSRNSISSSENSDTSGSYISSGGITDYDEVMQSPTSNPFTIHI
ncbi:hypothetical protein TBLA_0A09840 [Henningerozyma blattae CBS 6284]|uniref:Meiotically up-regulated protein Msb1/Mug8 domain-containing protein n=1 Tax=Henningerozyma blattae (strain ATCC 34711 / CBS 6284 / DSM 70876 / NBRC 10599 / NRRL Y-10934 / UCD 77-7) TaxID=1071380 RepID=I2GXB5_HENB6|nr:hypothetical protein TBLA_0A09840 [Tetrapisispora blattae CBS 6284]CCH58767.1 hypothetical protein TBLA_0A09840 [Tetrapisispora blattae CBS 6284]